MRTYFPTKEHRLAALVAVVILAALATLNQYMGPHTNRSVFGLADGHAKWIEGIQVSPGYGNNNPACDQDKRDNGDGSGNGICLSRPGNAAGAGNSKFVATFSAQ